MARRARQFSQRPASNPSSAMISCTSLCARHCHPLPLRCTRRCSSSHGDVEMAEHTHAPHTRARAKEWTWRTHSAPTARASLWSSRIVVPRGHGAMTHATSRRGRGTLSSGARDAISKQQLWQLVRSSGVRALINFGSSCAHQVYVRPIRHTHTTHLLHCGADSTPHTQHSSIAAPHASPPEAKGRTSARRCQRLGTGAYLPP